jgi:ABC-type phosphate/phosphonate transport system ATPase subunit
MIKKGVKRASADVGLIFTAFNLRRIMNIIDKNTLKKFLQELGFLFSIKSTSPKQNKAFKLIPFLENSISVLFLRAA